MDAVLLILCVVSGVVGAVTRWLICGETTIGSATDL
jgi:fluoride ion exporter CrcB/FEX